LDVYADGVSSKLACLFLVACFISPYQIRSRPTIAPRPVTPH